MWAQAQEKGFDVQAFRPYGGSLDLARVAQSRPVASQLAPEEVKDIQRALERLEQGGKLARRSWMHWSG